MGDTNSNDPFSAFFSVFKWAVGPFAAIGGWAGVRYVFDWWRARSDGARDDAKAAAQERDRVMASLDARAAAYMDRLERADREKQEEIDRLNEAIRLRTEQAQQDANKLNELYRARLEEAQREVDDVWTVASEQEQLLHSMRHAHLNTITRLEMLRGHCQRCITEGLVTEALRRAIEGWPDEKTPLDVPDMRRAVRALREARK